VNTLVATRPAILESADTLDLATCARALVDLGVNVGLQKRARKGRWPWKMLQTARLLWPDLLDLIALAGACNLLAMTGRLSGNLVILDCETEARFAEQCGEVRRRGIPLWASRSNSSKGGGHIWLRCAEGEIANISPGKLPDMEVRGNRCFVLTPPSVHPEGILHVGSARKRSYPGCEPGNA
jgi:hypothetical protein